MQSDFHFSVTYVTARLGGLGHEDAQTVAHSAQYVDDATNSGTVDFTNGALYSRISSSHKTVDYRNLDNIADHRVWIPFHFLPGNEQLPAGQDPDGGFIGKLICRPNSPVAQDMVRHCIERRGAPYGLHSLGITLHTYADTWAHQGFAGVNHQVNTAADLRGSDGKPDLSLMDRLANFFVGKAFPLGHGAVLSNPDKPWLVWSYTDGLGRTIQRDNPTDFLVAADHLCRAVQRFLAGDADAPVTGLPSKDAQRIDALLRSLSGDEDSRRNAWIDACAQGQFSFGPAKPQYVAKGVGSWKWHALGDIDDHEAVDARYEFKSEFLRSQWKLFHDALQAQRLTVLHDILPRYGICAD